MAHHPSPTLLYSLTLALTLTLITSSTSHLSSSILISQHNTTTTMSADAGPQFDNGQLPAAANADSADNDQKTPVKRSWRRKYRKMRAKFEDTMNQSNQLIKDEYKAIALARRLQEQNDQILEILLDINDTARIPSFLRYDLRSPSPSDTAIPSLETPDPDAIQQRMQELRAELVAKTITPEEYAQKIGHLNSSDTILTKPRSLATLEATVPHTTEAPDPLPEGLMLGENAPGYMSPNHEEEYLLAADSILADPTYDEAAAAGRPLRIPPSQPLPTDKDLTLRNPDSVYNWLRKHAPQVFLQDKDAAHHENMSEKSTARPSGTGGRGGKKGAAARSPGAKTDQDLDEDLGFVPETGTAAPEGKTGRSRKVKQEDEPYRPKGGSSRPGKRKREDGDEKPAGRGGRRRRGASGAALMG